jgi:hypothetical protein
MVKNFERMAALGALGVCGGVVLTYLGLAWLAQASPVAAAPGATGGVDGITQNVIWIAALVPTVIFVWSHVAFAKQLHGGPSSLND